MTEDDACADSRHDYSKMAGEIIRGALKVLVLRQRHEKFSALARTIGSSVLTDAAFSVDGLSGLDVFG
jgi:hypothetical protein